MGCCHCPGGSGHQFERPPEGFNDLTVLLAGSRNEVGSIPGIAAVLVTMDMEETDTSVDLDPFRQMEVRAFGEALPEMDAELAHDVVHDEDSRGFRHVVGQRLGQRIVHILLLFSLLEVNDRARVKTSVPRASGCSDAGGIQLVPVGICSIDRLVVVAG